MLRNMFSLHITRNKTTNTIKILHYMKTKNKKKWREGIQYSCRPHLDAPLSQMI